MEWTNGRYVISDDPDHVDRDLVHRFLCHDSYWSQGVPRAVVEKSIDHSLNLSVYDISDDQERGAEQVGYTRLITDRSTFAFLADVFVVPTHRGRGLAKWLCSTVLVHPDIVGVRRVLLGTDDAHGLYEQLGFTPLEHTERFMDIFRPAPVIYRAGSGTA